MEDLQSISGPLQIKDIDIDFTDVTITDCEYNGLQCEGLSNVTLDNIAINSPASSILCNGTSKENTNCRINNVTTTDGSSIEVSNYSNVNIENVTITDSRSSRIYCSGSSSRDILNINNVIITSPKGSGIYVRSYLNVNIDKATITDSEKGNGIYCQDTKTTKVRNSVIGRTANPGIYFRESETGDLGTADDPGNNQIFRNRQFRQLPDGFTNSEIGIIG